MEPRDLSAHLPYEAGRGNEEVARELGMEPDDLVVLSSNENPHGPSPAAVDAIREHAGRMHRYPKAAHADLRETAARRWDLDPEQVWLAAGGDGGLDYVHRALLRPGDRVLAPDPGFAYYGMSARYHHGDVRSYPLEKDDDFEQTAATVLEHYDGERVVYVTSPHNPTGSEMPNEEIHTVAAETDEETLVLVDEAYAEFSTATSAADLVDEREDVAVLRTFSKAYGLAGLRVGYILVASEWADAYAKVNTPFAVSELACRAALAALDDEDYVSETIESARWARDYVRDNLAARTWPSGGNFVLASVGDGEAVTEAAKRKGVLVRDCTSFGLPECIRITCGTEPETRAAVEVLNDVV